MPDTRASSPPVEQTAKRFQRDPLLLDLVGEENTGKLADTITLMTMTVRSCLGARARGGRACLRSPAASVGPRAPLPRPHPLVNVRAANHAPLRPRAHLRSRPSCPQVAEGRKPQSLADVLGVFGAGGKSIVFTRTKAGADEIAAVISQQQVCEALHGDIPQAQREKTLQRFRDGAFSVLVSGAARLRARARARAVVGACRRVVARVVYVLRACLGPRWACW